MIPPQHRVGDADHEQPQRDHHAEARVERKLSQEVAAEPRRRLVHRRCRPVQVAGPEQADQAVPQVFLLHQDEHGDDEHDAHRLQRGQDRRQHPLRHLHGAGIGLVDLDRNRCGLLRLRHGRLGGRTLHRSSGRLHLPAQLTGQPRDPAQGVSPHRVHLALDRGGVARHVACKLGHLGADDGAQRQDDAERQDDGADHRGHPRQPHPAQQHHQRRQHERQQHS